MASIPNRPRQLRIKLPNFFAFVHQLSIHDFVAHGSATTDDKR